MPNPPLIIGNGRMYQGDVAEVLDTLPDATFQAVIADPPYFRVLLDEDWDTAWDTPDAYLEWTLSWVKQCEKLLKPDGLFYIFGQLGKREHIWLHTCSMLSKEMQFHDMIIWDRAVGYNERSDSFTPQYEMVLVLRHKDGPTPFFNKDAVRLPYEEATIQTYLKDKRYKDKEAREEHLRKGKYATNLQRIPSLKGAAKEKVGHPSQKPIALIRNLIASSSRPGDMILDPFLGSGTTAVVAEEMNRAWVGVEMNGDYVTMAMDRVRRALAT